MMDFNLINSDNITRLYSSLPTLPMHKARVEIDISALRENYRALRSEVARDCEGRRPGVISVVKADAYGHGADRCTEALLEEGCDFFAVSCIEEAISVRRVCEQCGADARILILGYTLPEEAAILSEKGIIQTVFSPEYARALSRAASDAGCRIRVHIKLDTGMNRLGFLCRSDEEIACAAEDIGELYSLPGLDIEGIFTHFAKADEVEVGERRLTELQIGRYRRLCDILTERGICPAIRHASNSAASIRFGSLGLDYVREGILLYGAKASDCAAPDFIRPVMKLKTVISHIHDLIPGETVSYGGTFVAKEKRRIATLPIGYADGFIRAYGGALVCVECSGGEKKAPIVGRICMDQCMIDVSDIDCRVGDTVRIFGGAPEELYALAERAGTIDYEVLCLVSARVPRVYIS